MSYHEKLKEGNCPECGRKGDIKVIRTYEYVHRGGVEVRVPHTMIQCQGCKHSWLPQVLM